MRAFLFVVFALVLSACVVPVKIDRQFTVDGTTVSDGQISISLSQRVIEKEEKLKVIQDQDIQKHLITRAGNMLAGLRVRRTVKIDIEITNFLFRTGAFNHGSISVSGKVKLSENGKELESFTVRLSGKAVGSPDTKFVQIADQLAQQIHYYGGKRHRDPKKKK